MDLKGVEPSSLILSWYYQQVVLCESRRFRAFNQMVLSLQHTPYNMNNNFKEQLLLFMLTKCQFFIFYKYNKIFLNIKILLQLFCKNNNFFADPKWFEHLPSGLESAMLPLTPKIYIFVRTAGFEPATSRIWISRSNQLNYIRICRVDRTRTCDLLVPNQEHYQLCYYPIFN